MTSMPKYDLVEVALKDLKVVWGDAQRPYDEKWAQSIANDFDPEKFDALIVTLPNGDGVYHIIDGQHRRGAAEIYLRGDMNQKIQCRVIPESDPARAAEVFLGRNEGRKPVKPVFAFTVGVKAERDLEVAVNSIVRRCGYRIGDGQNENMISAVGALKKVYVKHGEFILRRTLDICHLLWGSDPQGVSGKIISGLGNFLNEFNSHVETDHLCKCINKQYTSPKNFIRAARFAKEQTGTATSMDVAMSEMIKAEYNRGVRDHKKLKRKGD